MDGLLAVHKPAGPTSHDVVSMVRRQFHIRRVGHAGTLDPMAEGVLVLLLGQATRLSEYASGHDKEYRAGLLLGRSTDTQDIHGQTLFEADASQVDVEGLHAALEELVGRIRQVPPMFSAVKVSGRRLYKSARAGEAVERPAREVVVRLLELVTFTAGAQARAELLCRVSAGTYIRTLCNDIGERLGVGGTMEWLVRTASGPFGLDRAHPLEKVGGWRLDDLAANLISMTEVLGGLDRVDLDRFESGLFCSGRQVSATPRRDGLVQVRGESGELLGIGKADGESGAVRPVKVLCSGS